MTTIKLVQVHDRLFIRGALSDHVLPADMEAVGVDKLYSLLARGQPSLLGWKGYRHVPMADGRQIPQGVHAVAGMVVNDIWAGHAVLVACLQGRNRSGLVVALALRLLCGISGVQAVQVLREARPTALSNATFEAYVMGLGAP